MTLGGAVVPSLKNLIQPTNVSSHERDELGIFVYRHIVVGGDKFCLLVEFYQPADDPHRRRCIKVFSTTASVVGHGHAAVVSNFCRHRIFCCFFCLGQFSRLDFLFGNNLCRARRLVFFDD